MNNQNTKSFYKISAKDEGTLGFYPGCSPAEAIQALREECERMGTIGKGELAFLEGGAPCFDTVEPVTDYTEMATARMNECDHLAGIGGLIGPDASYSKEYYQWIATAPIPEILAEFGRLT